MNFRACIILTVFLGHLSHTNALSFRDLINEMVEYPEVPYITEGGGEVVSFGDLINELVETPEVQDIIEGGGELINKLVEYPEVPYITEGGGELVSFGDLINEVVESPEVQDIIEGGGDLINKLVESPEVQDIIEGGGDLINKLVESPEVQDIIEGGGDLINKLVESPEVQDIIEGGADLINKLVKSPEVQDIIEGSGDVNLNVVSSIPKIIAFLLGIDDVASIENKKNTVRLNDDFIMEYTINVTNEDARLSGAELIMKYGFPLEIHNVETEDGYKLKMYRIRNDGPAVFLMHGLLGSSDDYIVSGPESGLAYLLAREGYDVWMGNARGNKYSRAHKSLNPSEKKFWYFSWHQIGVYDLPAMIDFVLKETKRDTLKYIGHSQGTTSFFVMASERPEYNDKISVMVALSPVAFMSNMKSPIIRLLAPGSPLIESVFKSLGVYEFLPDNNLGKGLKKALCEGSVLSELLCTNIAFLVFGFDVAQVNITNLPVISGHMPSGASIYQFAHYGQGIVTGEFAKYDYGSSNNEKVYGVKTPPKYELGKVRAPVALFYSDGDWLAHPSDVEKLSMKLSNVVEMYKVPNEKFNHLDFILAKDIKTLIYNRIQNVFKRF